MLVPVYGNKFKKDYKLALKRGIKAKEIDDILLSLINGIKLAPKHRDHLLIGNYDGFRECHIKNDFLLIYCIEGNEIIFTRLGTHSDLFN